MTGRFRWSILAAPLALIACSNTSEAPKSASAGATPDKPAKLNKDPYPSTYKPYPGAATAIRNVTIFDGEGGRIDNGVVFLPATKSSR